MSVQAQMARLLHHSAEPADAAVNAENLKVRALNAHGRIVWVLRNQHPTARRSLQALYKKFIAEANQKDFSVLGCRLGLIDQNCITVHDKWLHGITYHVKHDATLGVNADTTEKILAESVISLNFIISNE